MAARGQPGSSGADGGGSLAACKLTCYGADDTYAVLWPKPSTMPTLSKTLIPFKADRVTFTKVAAPSSRVYNKVMFYDYNVM